MSKTMTASCQWELTNAFEKLWRHLFLKQTTVEYTDKLIKKTERIIRRWHGRDARILELTRSHPIFSVIVLGDAHGSNLVIHCISPNYICCPMRWTNSAIHMTPAQLSDGVDGIALVDERSNVRVTAESFEVKENVRF